MSSPIWDDIKLSAHPTEAVDQRREALIRVLCPDSLIQAGRSLGTDTSLDEPLAHLGSERFRWILQRALPHCTEEEHQTLIASLTCILTLFSARQHELTGNIENMRRLTLRAIGLLNNLTAEEQLLHESANVFATGMTVAAMLDRLGERGQLVGPLRDMLGVKRDIVRPARVPVLFFHEGQRKGLVAWLHLEAVALGHGHAYADPGWLALQPMDSTFRDAMSKAWQLAVEHAGATRVNTLDPDGHGRPIDLRWHLEGLPADAEPIPLRGGSLSAALAAAMAAILLRKPVPDWWAISACVLPPTNDSAAGTFHPVEHLCDKVKAALAIGGPVRVVQVHPGNETEARESALALFNHDAARVDRVIVTADSLEQTLRRMAEHRQRVTEMLAGTGETHGAEIRRFLEEYRGSETRPVPFGGRDVELHGLHAWLDDPKAHPCLLWVAPAGRGKSALLVKWLDQLYARNDPSLKIVFVPISIRFSTSLETAALSALADRLARALGEPPPDPKSVDLSRIADYLRQSPRDGQRLLVVIDGLDEAAQWELTAAYLPREPERIRIVLSAREKPNDANGAAWLRQLGLPRECLRQLDFLNRPALANVLREMGFPLDRLSERVDIIEELFRLTEGDPLLVRLYVDDLWARGEAAARLQPEDLQQIEPGYRGYFRRWWEDQQKLWGERDLERIAEALLNVLAFARGPLGLDDVLELLKPEIVSSRTLRDRLLRDLSRFVIGNGKEVGFSLQHPKLRDYFRDELSKRERREYEERFLLWGSKTLEELASGKWLPSDVPDYLVQYLGQHLQETDATLEKMLPLLGECWQKAWERFDGATQANYLHDVRRVAALVRRINRAATTNGKQAPALGKELWCSLIEASIRSLTSNVSPELLQLLARKGLWSPLQGIAHVRQIADTRKFTKSLIALGQVIPQEHLDEILAAARQIEDAAQRVQALVELVERLPVAQQATILQQALATARQIEDASHRAQALAKLVDRLPVERALVTARQFENVSDRAQALAKLVDRLPVEQALETAGQIEHASYRAQALAKLVDRLPVEQALETAQQIMDGYHRAQALAKLVDRLPVEQALAIAGHIVYASYRAQALAKLVERLPVAQQAAVFQRALANAQQIWDPPARAQALVELVERLPIEQALQTAEQITDGYYRSQALAKLVDRLPVEQGLATAGQIEYPSDRAHALARLVDRLPVEQQETVLQQALETAGQIGYALYRAQALAKLAERLPVAQQATILQQALATAWQIEDAAQRVQALVELVERLPVAQQATILQQALATARQIEDASYRAQALAKLVERLPVERALVTARQIENVSHRAQALAKLADRLPVEQALSVARLIEDASHRAQALAKLVKRLPAEQALKTAGQIEYASYRAQALVELVERLPIEQALQTAEQITDGYYRSQALAKLVDRLPVEQQATVFHQALATAWRIEYAFHRAQVLVELVERLPVERALATARQIEDASHRAQALAKLAERLPVAQQATILQQALATAWQIEDAAQRVQALVELVERLPVAQQATILQQALATARQIEDASYRAQALAKLADRLPVEQALETAEQIMDGYYRSQALAKLADRLPVEQALSVARLIEDASHRAQALAKLVKRLPAEQALKTAGQIEYASYRAQALATLAERSAVEQQAIVLQQVLDAARQIEYGSSHARALAELVDCLPVEQALAVARLIEDASSRAQALAKLVERLPAERQYSLTDEAVTALLDGFGASTFEAVLQTVEVMLAKRPLAQADHQWARLLQPLPLRGRGLWLGILGLSLSLLEYLGGQQALLELKDAIVDVGRRWP